MPISRLWVLRIAATLGCLALLTGTVVSALLLIPHSWHDLDDANTRMHIFRFHIYDPDFIAAALAFGTTVIAMLAMLAVCVWMFWLLRTHWDMSGGKGKAQR